jgi:hypothetical protein
VIARIGVTPIPPQIEHEQTIGLRAGVTMPARGVNDDLIAFTGRCGDHRVAMATAPSADVSGGENLQEARTQCIAVSAGGVAGFLQTCRSQFFLCMAYSAKSGMMIQR